MVLYFLFQTNVLFFLVTLFFVAILASINWALDYTGIRCWLGIFLSSAGLAGLCRGIMIRLFEEYGSFLGTGPYVAILLLVGGLVLWFIYPERKIEIEHEKYFMKN